MSSVYKTDSDKSSIGSEEFRINLIQGLAPEIIVTVAGCSCKTGLGNPVLLSRCFSVRPGRFPENVLCNALPLSVLF